MNKILTAFLTDACEYVLSPINNGLIHQSFLVLKNDHPQYILQQFNHSVFQQPDIIAQNNHHIRRQILANDPTYPVLTFLFTNDGNPFYRDEQQNMWRLMEYLPDTVSIEKMTSPNQAILIAGAFGKFTNLLKDMDMGNLHPAIPEFHNLSLRYQQFEQALYNAHPIKKYNAEKLIQFLQVNSFIKETYGHLVRNNILPIRVQHCDTKISNLLFDPRSGAPTCVIDWDTVMPGYFLSDLGDMIRSLSFSGDENETDLQQLTWNKEIYEAIVNGYTALAALTEKEKEWIPFAGPFMIYQQALRFLTDYLNGDEYYVIRYPGQNLDRAKNQCHILQLLSDYVKFPR